MADPRKEFIKAASGSDPLKAQLQWMIPSLQLQFCLMVAASAQTALLELASQRSCEDCPGGSNFVVWNDLYLIPSARLYSPRLHGYHY
jgi:hypothetical protein